MWPNYKCLNCSVGAGTVNQCARKPLKVQFFLFVSSFFFPPVVFYFYYYYFLSSQCKGFISYSISVLFLSAALSHPFPTLDYKLRTGIRPMGIVRTATERLLPGPGSPAVP